MSKALAVVAGLVLGFVGCIPQGALLRASHTKKVGIIAGIAMSLLSFAIMCGGVWVMYNYAYSYLVYFGLATAVTYLGLWTLVAFVHLKSSTQGK